MADIVPVPIRLIQFPMYHGMLVHFTVWVGDDGIPDFKVVHESNRQKCMIGNLCALCGQSLEVPMVFIGGAGSIKNRLFVDGPMHEECATYATKVCPYLKIETWSHTSREPRPGGDGVTFREFTEVPIGRPRMGMYYTIGYRLVRLEAYGPIYYQAFAPTKIDWNAMPQPSEITK